MNTLVTKKLLIEELKELVPKLTPMMEQYFAIKMAHKDKILLFRMGDFYEVFFEDAVETSKILNIALTHRGKIAETPIPMAGIPHHAANTYIDKMTSAGKKVAICEQIEDPKEAKGIVSRAVTQIVTPSIPYDLDKADATINHYIFSFFEKNNLFYLCLIDFTTGDFLGLIEKDLGSLIDRLKSYAPKEFVTYFDQLEKFPELDKFIESSDIVTTHLTEEYFNNEFSAPYIEKIIPFANNDNILNSEPEFLAPIGALSYYLTSTQSQENFAHVKGFKFENTLKIMKVSHQTLTSLEIYPRSRELKQHSLIHMLDKTKSSMGSRKLQELTKYPLYDSKEIEKRLEILQAFLQTPDALEDSRKILSELRDIPRILAKLSTKKIQGFDLVNLAKSFQIFFDLSEKIPFLLQNIALEITAKDLRELRDLQKTLEDAINNFPGAHLSKGNLIKEGYSTIRDELANINGSVEEEIKNLESYYKEELQIPTLRVKSNNINGFFIEISKGHARKAPESFRKKQTLVNSERFVSEELDKIEMKLIGAQEKLLQEERKIFNQLLDRVLHNLPTIESISEWLSLVDTFQAFAWFSFQEDLTRPTLHDKKEISLTGAWHPLIKKSIKDKFVEHNILLNQDNYLALITGPNMAGKTTVMREVAIIQFLTQIGCFVPAKSAKVMPCDYIFSRIGASDDIVGGQSTFMVEMSETSEILRHASENSLVILDEIGRGTSTYDGLSIAWSILEYFVNEIKSFTLFSTHYHELIDVVKNLKGAKNFTVKTLNKNGSVQFLYELIEGGATQSFGINVAKLSGIPNQILARASKILKQLENEDIQQKNSSAKNSDITQLDMFSDMTGSRKPSQLEKAFLKIDPDSFSPKKALDELYRLKEVSKEIH